ncbi:MAG: hypothetical protein LBS05_10040 [Tannerellaceae bacterium]|jgi:hypothetical protein|nr:hypothetical protein [Tannerellaceae bacterium]
MTSEKSDWLPKGRVELLDRAQQTVDFVDANIVRIGMDESTPSGKWYQGFYDGIFTTFKTRVNAWKNPATRTKVISDKVREVEKEFIRQYRLLIAMLKANQEMSDADLEAAGAPKRPSGKRTPAPVATVPPGFEIVPMPGHQLRIDFFPLGEKSDGGKPEGQHGAEIKWGFSDLAVEDPEVLDHSHFDTASPAIITFKGSEMGRKVYIALRWENSRALKGPWSIPVEAVVP